MSSVLANRLIFVLSLAGAGVALYLTVYHATHIDIPCGKSGGCEEVANHCSAHGFCIPFLKAIPTAAFGLMMYLSLAALAYCRVLSDSDGFQRKAANYQWLLSLIGVATSAYLTYLEAFVIHAWCKYCVASAIITLLIFMVASAERFGPRSLAGLAPEGESS
jgi:uncharacterized membrane protein